MNLHLVRLTLCCSTVRKSVSNTQTTSTGVDIGIRPPYLLDILVHLRSRPTEGQLPVFYCKVYLSEDRVIA